MRPTSVQEQAIRAAMIREEGVGTYAGFVYADCVLIGVYTRH